MNCFKYTNNFHLSDRHVIENIKNVFFEFIEVYNHDMTDSGRNLDTQAKIQSLWGFYIASKQVEYDTDA